MIMSKEKAREILANPSAYKAEEVKLAMKILANGWANQ